MDEDDVKPVIKRLITEIEILKARNDVLFVALKKVLSAIDVNGDVLIEIISAIQSLDDQSLFSGQHLDEYRAGIESSLLRFQSWKK